MATKKSSSAAKKKAASKKQAVKKKSTAVKRPSAKAESAALYANDESAQASLQSAATTSNGEKKDKSGSGNGIYLFLVLAGVAALLFLGYAKVTKNQSASTTSEPPKLEKPVEKVEETPTAPEEAVKAAIAKFAVDKIESGKKWEEAVSYCEKLGASLPSKQEFSDYAKDAPKELTTEDIYWTKNFANNSKAFAFNVNSKKVVTVSKTEKHKVLCKN